MNTLREREKKGERERKCHFCHNLGILKGIAESISRPRNKVQVQQGHRRPPLMEKFS